MAPVERLRSDESALLEEMHAGLRELAALLLRGERQEPYWSPDDLINDTYLRIVRCYGDEWIRHANPRALWGRVMKHALVDRGRAVRCRKRAQPQAMDVMLEAPVAPVRLELHIAVRHALQRLAVHSRRQALAMQLGAVYEYNLEETARILNVTSRTIKRDLQAARAALRQELQAPRRDRV
jgi:RNA polymerase sigma-70 factor, ECF subfamily